MGKEGWVQNKSKQTICGIVSLIIFSCYLYGSETLVFSYGGLGNIEIEKLLADTAPEQPSHSHIVLAHLYSLENSDTGISLNLPSATAFIQPQLLSIQFSENLPNTYFLLSHQKFPHQILSKLSHTIILV